MEFEMRDYPNVKEVRMMFADLHQSDQDMELVGIMFDADDKTIFGQPNEDYIRRELAWYLSMSPRLADMEGPIPTIWKKIQSSIGEVNSNYGQRIFSPYFHSQYDECLAELIRDYRSRRAVMVYTNPLTIGEGRKHGANDQVCTMYVQTMIRGGMLNYHVHMRSCDAVLGYRNDIAWHRYVHDRLHVDVQHRMRLKLEKATIRYFVDSLHIYPHDIGLVGRWMKETGYGSE